MTEEDDNKDDKFVWTVAIVYMVTVAVIFLLIGSCS